MKEFATPEEAFEWLNREIDDPCVDNMRFAYVDDPAAVAKYQAAQEDGCCGFADYTVSIDGRQAWIGCNYGH